MNKNNTPKIGNALIEHHLDFIPEAHCYLSVKGQRFDYTSRNSDFNRIKNNILIEQEIKPYQVAKFKVKFHTTYIKYWIKAENVPFNFEEIWVTREICIANLSF